MEKSVPGVAVVGGGHWGSNHIRVWRELDCLRAICDLDDERLRALETAYPQIAVTNDLDSVLARSDIAGVVVATPPRSHAEVALRAIAAGKDVLIEKPLALRVEDGRRIVDAARESGRIVAVGHVLEYHAGALKLNELVTQGALGRLQYLSATRLNFGKIRTDESSLWSFAPHDIALMLRITGSSPISVACTGGAYLNPGIADVTVTNLEFPGGVRGHIYVSWLYPFKDHRFVAVGDEAMAVFDDTLPWNEKLRLFPHGVDWARGVVPIARKAEARAVELEPIEPLVSECRAFVAAIQSRRAPIADASSGVAVLEILEAAQASLDEGGNPRTLVGIGGQVHPSATVDPNARIGEGTRIWHYSHVMGGALVGARCVLGQNVFVGSGARIGNGVKIQNNVSVYAGVELEDDVFCGPSVVFTNVRNPRSAVDRSSEFTATTVRRGATLGANSTIVAGVEIGAYALVAAGAVVTRSVPDHAVVAGVPARRIGWACRCGESLELVAGRAVCARCGLTFVESGPDSVVVDE